MKASLKHLLIEFRENIAGINPAKAMQAHIHTTQYTPEDKILLYG